MTFLWPTLLGALILVPGLVALYVWTLRRRRAGIRYSSLSLVIQAAPGRSRLRRHLPFVLFVLAMTFGLVAMARPAVITEVPAGDTTIILAIDVSGSMCSTDIKPSRLQAAEAAAAKFIQQQNSNTLIGIVAFSTYGELVQAPTSDRNLLLEALNSLATGRRTAIGSGILTSIDAIAEIDKGVAPSITSTSPGVEPPAVPKGDYAPDIIVLLTDGDSNTGPTPLSAAQQAADRGVRVFTIGYGTTNPGSSFGGCRSSFIGREPGGNSFSGGFGGFGGGFQRGIDETTLKQVAALTGGTYHSAQSADQLQSVFDHLPTTLITRHASMEISVLLAALAALFAAGALLLARLWRPWP